MEKLEIARETYKNIIQCIAEIEEKHDTFCSLPDFIDVDGERFFKNDLHILSRKFLEEEQVSIRYNKKVVLDLEEKIKSREVEIKSIEAEIKFMREDLAALRLG